MLNVFSYLFICLLLMGCASATNEPAPTLTSAPTALPTITATATPEPTPELFTLSLQAFHDYNGNGTMDDGEPALEGIVNMTGGGECTTGADGKCEIDGLSANNYELSVDSSKSLIEELDFMFIGTDVVDPKKGINVNVHGDTNLDVALGQGFLPLPIAIESFGRVTHPFGERYYDGSINDYRNHLGFDILIIGEGPQPVYSPLDGFLQPDPNGGWGECNLVNISYNRFDYNFVLGIGHLTEIIVEPGEQIKKGDIIGYVNPNLYPGWVACTTEPHIEMSIWGSIDGVTWNNVEGKMELLPIGGTGWINPAKFFPKTDFPSPMYIEIP